MQAAQFRPGWVARLLSTFFTPRLACLLAVAALHGPGHAQVLLEAGGLVVVPWAVGHAQVVPALGCGVAAESLINVNAMAQPFAIRPLGTYAPDAGDVAYNRMTGEVWVTDGNVFQSHSIVTRAILRSFTLPGFTPQGGFITPLTNTVTGMGCTSGYIGTDVLWITQRNATATTADLLMVTPPPLGSPVGTLVVPTATVQVFPNVLPGMPLDIDFDPATGFLWVGDAAGWVTQLTITGALGPFGSFRVNNMLCAPSIPQPVKGIAVDTCAAMPGVLFVHDSGFVRRIIAPGLPAPRTNYDPGPGCMGISAGSTQGIAFAARPVSLSATLTPANQNGEFLKVAPYAFAATNSGSGGTLHILGASLGVTCPAINIPGTFLNINLGFDAIVWGMSAPPPFVDASVPVSYPPTLPIGFTLFLQWFTMTSNGGFFSGTTTMLVHSRP